jgi:hypothetical protein
MDTQFWLASLKERDHCEDVGIDVRIILWQTVWKYLEDVDWIHIIFGRNWWWLLSWQWTFRFSKIWRIFRLAASSIGFSRRTLLHGGGYFYLISERKTGALLDASKVLLFHKQTFIGIGCENGKCWTPGSQNVCVSWTRHIAYLQLSYLSSWWWRQQAPLRHRLSSTRLRDAASQKTSHLHILHCEKLKSHCGKVSRYLKHFGGGESVKSVLRVLLELLAQHRSEKFNTSFYGVRERENSKANR